MNLIMHKFKHRIKANPILGPIALSIWHQIKPKLKKTSNSCCRSGQADRSYANLNTAEIKQRMDERYEQSQAYNYNLKWDMVRLEEINDITMRMISPFENKEILELGCALGGVAAFMSNCKRYIGTDISEKAVEIANKNLAADNISFQMMDALNIKFDDNSFDIVLAREVIEHLPDIDKCFREVYRVLRPGGILILTSPNKDSLHLRVCQMMGLEKFTCSFDHINEISYLDCKGKLETAGFEIAESEGIFLKPYWGIPGLDEHVRQLTDNNPEMIELQRKLGRLCGAEFAFCYAIKAIRPAEI